MKTKPTIRVTLEPFQLYLNKKKNFVEFAQKVSKLDFQWYSPTLIKFYVSTSKIKNWIQVRENVVRSS